MRITIATLLAAVILQGCCGCDKKSTKYLCEAGIQGEKGIHHAVGTDENQTEARDSAIWGACYTYCTWEDPEVDAAYQEWKKTEKGQSSILSKADDIGLVSDLETLRDDCREKCQASVASGIVTVGVKCHPPQGGEKCTTTLEYGGSTWTASEDGEHSKHHSRRLACRRYCKEGDPHVSDVYEKWKETEKGRTSSYSSKDRALEINSFLVDTLNQCQGYCMGDLLTGVASATTSCD